MPRQGGRSSGGAGGAGGRPGGRSGGGRSSFQRSPFAKQEWDYKVLGVSRVTRVSAGGKRFKIRAVVVSGNRSGMVGVGVGKGADFPQSIEKARRAAERSAIRVPIVQETIPFEVTGHLGSGTVMVKPAARGRGLVAGGAVRLTLDLAGVKNATAKIITRTKNPLVNTRACLLALMKLKRYQAPVVAEAIIAVPVVEPNADTPTEAQTS